MSVEDRPYSYSLPSDPMALTLKIENETHLTDGGPLSYTVSGKRSIDIGRDSYLDWTLPDPSRRISSKHCEIRYRDNAYWLHDVSTNGTYLNGNDRRMSEPHRLRNGDRLVIGHYIISVALDGGGLVADPFEAPATHSVKDHWGGPSQAPEPATRSIEPPIQSSYGPAFAPPLSFGQSDFLDWMVDLPPLVPDGRGDRGREPEGGGYRSEAFPAAGRTPLATEPAHIPAALYPANSKPRVPDSDLWDQAPPEDRRVTNEAEPHTTNGLTPPQWSHSTLPEPPARGPKSSVAAHPEPAAEPSLATSNETTPSESTDEHRYFLAAFANAAGIPASALMHYDAERLGTLLGRLLHCTVADLAQLLAGRFEAKRAARSSHQTQIEGTDNNPIKFLPSAEEALKVMLGPPNRSYLDAVSTLQASFADIKSHQLETYVAMQAAVLALAEDFDPAGIEAAAGESGLSALVGSRKSRAWEIYVARWDAKTVRHDNGMVGAFTEYFSKHYDQ